MRSTVRGTAAVLIVIFSAMTSVTSFASTAHAPATREPLNSSYRVAATGLPDFSITANPPKATLVSGSSTTVQVALTSLNSFSGNVVLSASFLPLDGGFAPSIVLLKSGNSNSSALEIVAPIGLSPGNYDIFLTAASSCSLVHSLFISIGVTGPDLSISPTNSLMSISPGTSKQSNIEIAGLDGFSGSVTVTASITPAISPLSTSPNFTTISVSAGTPASYPLTITAHSNAAPGNYTISLIASSGTLINSTSIVVSVPGASFALSTTRQTITVNAGGASNATVITVVSLSGFTDLVNLTATPSPGSNLAATMSIARVTLPGSSQLTVSAPSTTPPGDYYVDVTGTDSSGSLSRDAFVNVIVRGASFQLLADPTFLSVAIGGSKCLSTIDVVGLGGFNQQVLLSSDTMGTGVGAKLGALTVTGSGNVSLSVLAGTAAPGSYDIDITGQSGATLNSTVTITVLVSGPDFSLSAAQTSLTITAGGSGKSTTITVNAENKFAGVVNLVNSTSDPGIRTTLSPLSITGSGNAALTISADSSLIPDIYSVEVDGQYIDKSGEILIHAVIIAVTVQGPDFALSASPNLVSINPTLTGTATITVTPLSNFNGPVTLAAFPSTNLTAIIQPGTVMGGSGTATLTVNSTTPGFYTVDVEGSSSSGIIHDIVVDVNDGAPTFALSASPTSITLLAGSQGNSTVTVNGLNGFAGTVGLAAATNSTSLSCGLSATSVSGGSGSSKLSCNASIAGTYHASVTATSGQISQSVTVNYNIQDFALRAAPGSIQSIVGNSATSTITIAPDSTGFSGTVDLSVSENSTSPSCDLSSIAIPGASGSSTVSCTDSIAGNYNVTITGSGVSLQHSVSVIFRVIAAPNFNLLANPTGETALVNASGTTTVIETALSGFAASVTLMVSSNSTNLLCSLSSKTITSGSGSATLSCHSPLSGNYLANVTGTANTLIHFVVVTFHVQDFSASATSTNISASVGSTGSSTITILPVNGFSGKVSLTVVTNSTDLSCALSVPTVTGGDGSSILSCNSLLVGNFLAGISANSSSLKHLITVTYHVSLAPDFLISVTTTSLSVNVDAGATSAVYVSSLNGFTGTVALSEATNSTSLSCSITSPFIAGGSGQTGLTCQGLSAGNYQVTVSGTAGGVLHSLTVRYHIQDFDLSNSPADVSIQRGGTGSSTVTVLAINGFTGGLAGVALSATTNSTDLSCKLSTTTITIGTISSTLSCTASTAGNYSVLISGSNAGLVHSVGATYHVQDFRVMMDNSGPIDAGDSAIVTIEATSLNGFYGSLNLVVTSQAGLSCGALSQPTISLPVQNSSIVACTSNNPGSYLVTFTASNGQTVHQATTIVVVNSQSNPAPNQPKIEGLDPTAFYAIIGALALIGISGAMIFARKILRPSKKRVMARPT